MFDITRRDIAWGTGIASVIATAAFLSIFNSAVNSTGGAFGEGKERLVHAARGVIAKGFLQPKKAEAGTSLPFQSVNIAVEGNRIVRVDDKSRVWPIPVQSTKTDRGVMPDDQEVDDLLNAELVIEDKNSSKHMLARLQ